LFIAKIVLAANMVVAGIAPANTAIVPKLVHFGGITEAPAPTAVVRRDEEIDAKQQICMISVVSELMPPLPDNQKILSWAYQNGEIDKCTITVPASVSSDVTSYLSVLTHWYETIDDKAAKQTDCGYANFTLPIDAACKTSRTVFITDSPEHTATSLVYPPFSGPTNGLLPVGGTATRNTGMIRASLAIAGLAVLLLV
jgi:hypothetical protein